VVKSHGGADAEGFAYAVDVGYEMVHFDLLTKINQMLNRDGGALVSAPAPQEPVS
jgi:glycerol-3-phosphate acyltransferase PlsX